MRLINRINHHNIILTLYLNELCHNDLFNKIHKPDCLGKENLGWLKAYNWQAKE